MVQQYVFPRVYKFSFKFNSILVKCKFFKSVGKCSNLSTSVSGEGDTENLYMADFINLFLHVSDNPKEIVANLTVSI